MNNVEGKAVCILVDYHHGNHRPYRNCLHDAQDESVDQARSRTPLEAAIIASGAVDGDEIEIIVRKTGNRPFGDRKYRYTAPHTYEREP